MKIPFKSTAMAAALAGLVSVPLVWADEDMPETDTTEVVEIAETVPGERIAGYFSEFFGEESSSVVAGLRDGSIQYVEPLPEGEKVATDTDTDTTETDGTEVDAPEVEDGGEPGNGMGYGNVLITMALAEQLAGLSAAEALEGEEGMTAHESLNEILRMRQVDGMGWGQIARELGVNLGEVVSGIRSNRPDMTEKLARRDERAAARSEARAERELARADKVAKVEKAERVAKLDRPERPVRPEKAEKPERPEKPARPERPGR